MFGTTRWFLGMVMGSAIALSTNCASAQITPDKTLPNNSTIRLDVSTHIIEGGTRAGGNLFHSFGEFSVRTGETAHFNNAADVQNIFGRVTGGTVSNIDGLIKANGTANLFLINPNGIVFGQNARLDIGGSFVATTANAIGFGNQGFFSATNPNNPELLTVNPSAFFLNQIAAAPIQNNSVADAGLNPSSEFTATGLRVPDGKSLLLVGGDINMDGGGLYAFGGRVELGGLAGRGTVGLNGSGNNLSLNFPNSVERSNVSLSNGAGVLVIAGGGGSIAVNARNLEMTGESFLSAGIEKGLGSDSSKAGNIEVNATGAINLDNGSQIANNVRAKANGQGGNVNISASTLQVKGGSQVSASTFGSGNGGNLSVDAQDVQLIGTSASNDLIGSSLLTSAQANSTGNAGDLTIKTNTLSVKDGAQVFTGTYGSGKGGNLTVIAQDLQLIGRNADGQVGSGLTTSVQRKSTGNAGDLTIRTNTLLVRDGAQVGASTFGSGNGGNLTVNAQDVQLIGRTANGLFASGLGANADQGSTGNAGNLIIKTNTLLVKDGAAVSVQSYQTGTAGNMTLNARSIDLDNNALLTANTRSAKVDPNREQATINIISRDLIMRRGSNIRTNATGENVLGGNININSDIIAALENSDISANSTNSRGGNVKINTQGIFGTQFRDAPTSKSDITATGGSPELSGTVQINTLGIDPTQGLVNLPVIPVDTKVAQGCYAGGTQGQSEFIITGRGGLPPNPGEPLSTDAVDVGLVTLNHPSDNRKSPSVSTQPTKPTPKPIVEATGWVINAKGEVELIANAPTSPHGSWQNPVSCRASSVKESSN